MFEHMHRLKRGEDILTDDGKYFRNADYTADPKPTRSYAYCSDTLYWERVADSVKGVDLLYHEATFTEKDIERARATYHSTARQAAEIAKRAGARQLIMGHLSARYDQVEVHIQEAKAVFPESTVVEDGSVFTL